MTRTCGDCQLCCKLLPMKEGAEKELYGMRDELFKRKLITAQAFRGMPDFNKAAGCKCPHQKHGVGCTVYRKRPLGCQLWQCRWLANADTEDQHRPDRCHYVIDMTPDYVTTNDGHVIQVLQIWVDPHHRDAYKDPALRRYLARRAEEGYAALIRWNNKEDCMFLIYAGGKWIEKKTNLRYEPQHTTLQKAYHMQGAEIPYDIK